MATTQIALFEARSGESEGVIENALKAQHGGSQDTIVGLQIQDWNAIQLITEKGPPDDSPVFRSLQSSCGEPTASYNAQLSNLALGPGGPATAPVLEVVANYFPVSRITPGFQKQIEADFAEFDRICKTMAKGDIGLAHGWSVEEIDHADVEGEKTRPFFILRGWQSMRDFENLTKQEKFGQEAIPKLLAWKAPFKMWHVERKS